MQVVQVLDHLEELREVATLLGLLLQLLDHLVNVHLLEYLVHELLIIHLVVFMKEDSLRLRCLSACDAITSLTADER